MKQECFGSATCLTLTTLDFEEVYETLGGQMFHLEKVFCAGNPQLALEGLQSIAKTEWLKYMDQKIGQHRSKGTL